MAKPYLISKPNSETLVLTKSRRHAAWKLGSLCAFYTFWYIFQLAFHKGFANLVNKVMSGDWFTILFVIAPLLSIKDLFREIWNVFNPRVITFDSDSRRILDRNKSVGTYEDVTGVVVKTIKDSDGPNEYSLMVRLNGNTKLRVDQSKNHDDTFELADEIAEILKVSIEKSS